MNALQICGPTEAKLHLLDCVSRIHMLESTRGGVMTGEEDTAGIVGYTQSRNQSVGAKSGKGSMCGESDTNGWVSPETALHRGGVVGWATHRASDGFPMRMSMPARGQGEERAPRRTFGE